MSDTPRTDAAQFNRHSQRDDRPTLIVPAEFARELERELAAVTAEKSKLIEAFATMSRAAESNLAAVTAERDALREEFETLRAAAKTSMLFWMDQVKEIKSIPQHPETP